MRKLAWTLAALTIALGAARTGLLIVDVGGPEVVAGVPEPAPGVASALAETFMTAVFAGLGAILAARRSRNPDRARPVADDRDRIRDVSYSPNGWDGTWRVRRRHGHGAC